MFQTVNEGSLLNVTCSEDLNSHPKGSNTLGVEPCMIVWQPNNNRRLRVLTSADASFGSAYDRKTMTVRVRCVTAT